VKEQPWNTGGSLGKLLKSLVKAALRGFGAVVLCWRNRAVAVALRDFSQCLNAPFSPLCCCVGTFASIDIQLTSGLRNVFLVKVSEGWSSSCQHLITSCINPPTQFTVQLPTPFSSCHLRS